LPNFTVTLEISVLLGHISGRLVLDWGRKDNGRVDVATVSLKGPRLLRPAALPFQRSRVWCVLD